MDRTLITRLNLDGEEQQFPLRRGWGAPETVRLENDALVFEGEFRDVRVRNSQRLLVDFMALGEPGTRAAKLLKFARAYGPLEICRHGLPAKHAGPDFFRWPESRNGVCVPTFREPVAIWRSIAREFFSLARIAAALNAGQQPEPDWWRDEGSPRNVGDSFDAMSRIATHPDWLRIMKDNLASAISRWMIGGGVRPILTWEAYSAPVIEFGATHGSGLLATLALRLALSAAGYDQMFWCDGCGALFTPPNRKPKAGQRAFCLTCRGSGRREQMARDSYRERLRHSARDSAEKPSFRQTSRSKTKKRGGKRS